MNALTIKTEEIGGRLTVQPSKYLAHRHVIAASLAEGESLLSPVAQNDDVAATVRAVESLGLAACSWNGKMLTSSPRLTEGQILSVCKAS